MNVKLSTKGQLIIPGPIRQRHGWNAGAELVIEDRGDHLGFDPPGKFPGRS